MELNCRLQALVLGRGTSAFSSLLSSGSGPPSTCSRWCFTGQGLKHYNIDVKNNTFFGVQGGPKEKGSYHNFPARKYNLAPFLLNWISLTRRHAGSIAARNCGKKRACLQYAGFPLGHFWPVFLKAFFFLLRAETDFWCSEPTWPNASSGAVTADPNDPCFVNVQTGEEGGGADGSASGAL